MIIPSIDIMDGKAVQLRQGADKVIEKDNVFELAEYFSRFGEIAIIDLDAAMGKGDNLDLIKQLIKKYPARVGGGIRTHEKALDLIASGAKRIIIGTAACENLLSQLPKERLIVAIDTKNGKVVTEGWMKTTEFKPEEYVNRFNNFCSGYLYTIVEKEGMMSGTDVDAIRKIRELTEHDLTAAGGICAIDEIKLLDEIGANSQLGMCIYNGSLDLKEAFANLLDFEKTPLMPTIVQDLYSKQVLMLAYSNAESLKKSFEDGLATYYSRSREELWTKGETSGNTQRLVNVKYDCDKDALLFTVEQKGVACHTGAYSCFGEREFVIHDLVAVLEDRLKDLPEGSFTTKLFNDEFYLKRKIMEEAFEVVSFKEGDGLPWEMADLTYFLLAFMVKNNVDINDVLANLASRRK
ncbi:MAG: bifunctional phosphoribosyl-AMP cyclohydrolase/phosphoribosyl-ATP diphosphatase HisIE [Candidatus Gastranaerophilales bacterium]|nr:bifunctional phosphoribosyl-AMP cyclohydrolase/phosphoribosyl-ATP diphosphatase HisIE [Candidatus Gastranaerophilales bacterium]